MSSFVMALEDSGLSAWGFLFDCMGRYMCVTLILFRISRYLCNDSIVYPRRDDSDYFSEATSESSEKFNKTINCKLLN